MSDTTVRSKTLGEAWSRMLDEIAKLRSELLLSKAKKLDAKSIRLKTQAVLVLVRRNPPKGAA